MAQTETEERLGPGTVVDGRYEVVSLLGSGGFANVYLANHKMLGTEVAIKVLHAPLASSADPQFAARFEREAKVAAQMRHPNVVNVTDFGFTPDGDPYLVMERLRGRDLEEELKLKGTLDPDRLVRLMVPCIQAIGEAHKMGIVHKDLKPSNLFLVDAGEPTERLVVLDFGVARVFDDADANITQTGAFTGTPAYLPPEYIREQRVTAAFDVYQMGLILIECMSGQKAIEADGPMGFLLAHCMGRVTVEPEFFNNDLGQVIQKAISIEDTDRYPDCTALAAALSTVVPPAADFDGRKFTRPNSPISSNEVAAFADTLSSGQIIGDAFTTGGGPGVDNSGQNRAHVPNRATETIDTYEPPGKNRTLMIVAVVAIILVLGAAGFVGSLVLKSQNEGEATTEVPAVDPLAAATTTPELVLEEIPVDPGLAVAQASESVSGSLGVADADAKAEAESRSNAADAAEREAQLKAEREELRRELRRRVEKRVARPTVRKPKSEPKEETEPVKTTPKKRLLVVD